MITACLLFSLISVIGITWNQSQRISNLVERVAYLEKQLGFRAVAPGKWEKLQ